MTFRKRIFSLLLALLLLAIISCEKKPSDNEPEMIKGAETEKTKSGQIIPVEALVIQPQRITQNIPLTGILQPNHQVDIVAEVSGKVTQINKRLGEPVTIKDTLAVIDDKIPLSNYRQARSQVLSAENNLKIAKLNLKSDKELFNNGDISQLAVKSAEASRLSALANLSLLEKNYRDTRITSPINGLISRKNIDMGMMVTPGTPLYRVVDLTTLKIKVGVPQSMISHISTGSSAEVEISALNNQVFKGNVHHISPQADENTGAFNVEIQVKNTEDLKIRAGMTAKINLILIDKKEQIVIPDHAVVTKNGDKFIYKINNNTAKLVNITIGEVIGSQMTVNKGLAQGDTIVVVGMKNLGVETKVWIEIVH